MRNGKLILLTLTALSCASAAAADNPLEFKQNGPGKFATPPAETAAAPSAMTQARADNVLFTMPDGWRRKDQDDGVTAIFPPEFPKDQWIEIRFVPGEPKNGSARDHLARRIELIKKSTAGFRALADIAATRGAEGAEAVLQPIAVQDGEGKTTLFVLCYAEAGDLVQPIFVATNSGPLYQQHSQILAKILESVRFANQIKLAEGTPPLTLLNVYRVQEILEWILDVPMTQDQKKTIEDHLVKAWKANDRSEIDGLANLLTTREQANQLEKTKRDFARQTLQDQALKTWRASKDDIDQFLVGVYEAGHKPLAAGDPALTRQVTDSVSELMYFMASQVDGGGEVTPAIEVKDQLAQKMAANWSKMDPAAREQMVKMPMLWAAVRAGWPDLNVEQRKAMVGQFAGMDPVKQLATYFAKVRQDNKAKIASQQNYLEVMRNVQRQHESYTAMSNVMYSAHQANMMSIYSMGNGWAYKR